jgi:phosphoribosyl-AMP cyclohydrolase / phosphoribosyl-ATP pyrophosphohydrolase
MIDITKLDFTKLNGLLPAVIVDDKTGTILMLGFMNKKALETTIQSKRVTFFSRSKNRLWTKGETSGNYLSLKNIITDCDNDSLIVYADPQGPTCHLGDYSCFGLEPNSLIFLDKLEKLIRQRKAELPEGSYTTTLFNKGSDRIVQKFGEEATELVIAAKNSNKTEIVNESADLLYHFLVLLADNGIEVSEIVDELKKRHTSRKAT